jgi:demethylmenaquinone methyltransferase/2-methoxy-6-polyprenyl-1,4-benzoquinol methylase
MSSIVLMRILESAPDRYDTGMRVLSLGAVPRAHRATAALAVRTPGARVLEIGCGTGAVTQLLLKAGAHVEALDQNPEMLDRARTRLADIGAPQLVLRDSTAAEIDGLDAGSFDAVVASLSLSEMSRSERGFVLKHAARVLKGGGQVVICDEVQPRAAWQRLLHLIIRLPLVLLTWLIAGTTTNALPDPTAELEAAGLRVISDERSRLGTLAVIAAEKPA